MASAHDDPSPPYLKRFRRVLEHIEARLSEDLKLDALSSVAAYSKFHFHRQFTALFDMTVHEYVQGLRLRRAAHQLAFREPLRIIDVAMEAGYESHEAFSRAFRKTITQSPSDFRKAPQWEAWSDNLKPLTALRSQHMKQTYVREDVSIIDFPETLVGVLEHRGDHRRLGESIRTFIEWRKQNHLPPSKYATFNVFYDDPMTTAPEAFRLDLCVAIAAPVAPNAFGIVTKSLPGGRCAMLRHRGTDDTLGDAASFLYRTWLPSSGCEPRDFPLFAQRLTMFPDVPENEATLNLMLPIA